MSAVPSIPFPLTPAALIHCTVWFGVLCLLFFLFAARDVPLQFLYLSFKLVNRCELLVYDLKLLRLRCQKFLLRVKLCKLSLVCFVRHLFFHKL